MMVLIGHAISIFPQHFHPLWPQQAGVAIFFLLSGYLISQTLHRRLAATGSTFLDFAIDRWARIYSGFLPALIVVAALDYCASNYSGFIAETRERFTVIHFFENLFMLQAPDFALPFGSAAPFWTVAIEFWIYMFVGAVAFAFRDGIKPLGLFGIAIAGIIPVSSLTDNNMVLMPWLLGAAVERVVYSKVLDGLPRLIVLSLGAIAIAVFALMLRAGYSVYSASSYLCFAIAFTMIALAFRPQVVERGPLKNCITWWASWSYSLYLLHHSILMLFGTAFGTSISPLWATGVSIVSAIAFASLTEVHHKALADYIKSLRSRGPYHLSKL